MNFSRQVPGKHLCGHAGMVRGSSRHGRINDADRRDFRYSLCMECNKAVQSMIDEARADTPRLALVSGLQKPSVRGSLKQQSWALAIVGEVFPLLSAIAAVGRARGDDLGISVARAVSLISQVQDAGFWIKQQHAYRAMNAYCITGDVSDIIRRATHGLYGAGTSWLAGLIPGTSTPDRHYKFAQKALLSRLISEPAVLDAVSNG